MIHGSLQFLFDVRFVTSVVPEMWFFPCHVQQLFILSQWDGSVDVTVQNCFLFLTFILIWSVIAGVVFWCIVFVTVSRYRIETQRVCVVGWCSILVLVLWWLWYWNLHHSNVDTFGSNIHGEWYELIHIRYLIVWFLQVQQVAHHVNRSLKLYIFILGTSNNVDLVRCVALCYFLHCQRMICGNSWDILKRNTISLSDMFMIIMVCWVCIWNSWLVVLLFQFDMMIHVHRNLSVFWYS